MTYKTAEEYIQKELLPSWRRATAELIAAESEAQDANYKNEIARERLRNANLGCRKVVETIQDALRKTTPQAKDGSA